jgi:hypothetical protein
MSDEDWVLDEADRQEGDSAGVKGLKVRYWMRFLKGMVTDRNRRHRGLSYPPGPWPLPIIGNLLDIPKDSSWLAYTQFSKKYGNSPSFPTGIPADSIDRGYHVFLCFGASYRRVELGQSSQGLARKEWRYLL